MASARAFGILNNQNQVNGNFAAGKNTTSLKNGESRSSTAFALKDLTNNNKAQRTVVHQDAKSKMGNAQKLQKSTKTIMQKIQPESKKVPRKPANASHDMFSIHEAEYAWGQAACLRDDLLEQMIEYRGTPCEIKRKPLPPVRPEPLDLPGLDDLWEDQSRSLQDTRFSSVKPLDLPADDFPLVDIQDLEFIF